MVWIVSMGERAEEQVEISPGGIYAALASVQEAQGHALSC
jgi:hypothetical protein